MKLITAVELNEAEQEMIIKEANQILAKINEDKLMSERHEITKVIVSAVGEELDIQVFTSPHITRVRRITGYMSDVDRWNDAKQAELKDRKPHL